MGSGVAGADHDRVRRRHAGDAAQQQARAPVLALQEIAADLHRQPAGNLRHRFQQRQRAVGGLDRFIRNSEDAFRHQHPGELRSRREMQVGEERLLRLEQIVLRG